MRKQIQFIGLVLIILMISCKYPVVTVQPQPKANDITISPEMRELKTTLQTTKSLSVVLRVPSASDKVTAEQAAQNAELYNRIERNLLKAGFTVRDRGLLESLLKSGQTNYEEIGKKIETDIIIEILSLNLNEDNPIYNVVNKKDKKTVTLYSPVNPAIARMDCKLTIVNKGLMGGVLTLYKTACTEGCDFEYFHANTKSTYMRLQGTPRSAWEFKLKFPPSIDKLSDISDYYVNNDSYYKIIDYFSDILIGILRGNF